MARRSQCLEGDASSSPQSRRLAAHVNHESSEMCVHKYIKPSSPPRVPAMRSIHFPDRDNQRAALNHPRVASSGVDTLVKARWRRKIPNHVWLLMFVDLRIDKSLIIHAIGSNRVEHEAPFAFFPVNHRLAGVKIERRCCYVVRNKLLQRVRERAFRDAKTLQSARDPRLSNARFLPGKPIRDAIIDPM